MYSQVCRGAFRSLFQSFLGVGVVTASLAGYAALHLSLGWRLFLSLVIILVLLTFLVKMGPGTRAQTNMQIDVGDDGEIVLEVDGEIDLEDVGPGTRAQTNMQIDVGDDGEIVLEVDGEIDLEDVAQEENEEQALGNNRGGWRSALIAVVASWVRQVLPVILSTFLSIPIFQAMGFARDSVVILLVAFGIANLGSLYLASSIADSFDGNSLFAEGSQHIIFGQVAALILTSGLPTGFAWSWDPLSRQISGTIFPIKIRSRSVGVAVNIGFTVVQTQVFLNTLCDWEYTTFILYAIWVVITTFAIAVFLPERCRVPRGSCCCCCIISDRFRE